jgi:hypothetical protein
MKQLSSKGKSVNNGKLKRFEKASTGPDGAAVMPPAYGGKTPERESGISVGENQAVWQLTGGQVDLHAAGARVHSVAPTDPRLRAVGATSYTQGKLALIGNAKDRGHEIWHLAQQAQKRVHPTTKIGGQPVNLERGLEREADSRGSLIARHRENAVHSASNVFAESASTHTENQPIQGNGISLLEDSMKKPKDVGKLTNLPELLQHGWDGTAEQKELDQLKASFRMLSAGWSSGSGEVLSALLKKHGKKNNVTKTAVTFGSESTFKRRGVARASKMVANPLTSRPGNTTGSDATAGEWSPNIEGHLLNHLLHGPAEYKNLAPFSRSMNGVHSKNVEEPLKRMVFNEDRYFKYTVVTSPENATKDEEYVPTHINFDVRELNKDDLSIKDDGYQYGGRINQAGNLSNEVGQNLDTVPTSEVKLSGSTTDTEVETLATYWNGLQSPWSRAYGDIVALILDATYDGVKADEAHNKVDMAKRTFLPRTEVQYGPTATLESDVGGECEVAKSMTAFPLTLRPPEVGGGLGYGYEPETPVGWAPYVAGHLLNHHLHGPAKSRNITPMTQTLNRKFEKEVEDPLKTQVMSQGRVMGLKVEMRNGEDDRNIFESKSGYFPGALQATITRYLPKEGIVGKDREKKKNWIKIGSDIKNLRNNNNDD